MSSFLTRLRSYPSNIRFLPFIEERQSSLVATIKQLPPSKFFTAAFSDDDTAQLEDESEDEAYERLSQIEVKDCTDLLELAAPVFPKVMLNIHYRSRFRQLIDFSNSAFYEGRLSVPVLHPLEKIIEFKNRFSLSK